jgi:hypothetical protein
LGQNEKPRHFLLKIQKPSWKCQIERISVIAEAGSQNHFVLFNQLVENFWDRDVWKLIGFRNEIPLVETDLAELQLERVRKEWVREGTWIPEHVVPNSLVEYYRVRVTPSSGQPAFSYGLINGQIIQPPSDTLKYKFRIHFRVGNSSELQTRDVSATHPPLRAHWSAAQFFQNSRYGGWNNDKWVLRSVWTWLSSPANLALLEPVNDTTLEHGRNIGHGREHLRGDAFDTFHPGYLDYRDSAGNPFVLDQNAANGEGGRFRDILRGDLALARNPQDSPQRQQARARLITWIHAARTRVNNIVNSPAPAGHQQSRMLYLVAQNNRKGNPAAMTTLHQDCIQLRALLFTGKCVPFTIPGSSEVPGLDLGLPKAPFVDLDKVDARFAWDITDTHSHHLHLTFRSPGN